jgi:hypothetical protein
MDSNKALLTTHFLYKRQNEKITVLIIYVDDMVITENNIAEIEKLEEHLAQELEVKNLRSLKYFLGIGTTRSKQDVIL